MEYRNLLEYEIAQLEASGCTATNWNTVSVKDGFNPSCYIRVNFSGNVKLGNTGICLCATVFGKERNIRRDNP